MPEYQLTQEIISRSNSRKWDAAKLEWRLSRIYEADEAETCLCGHYPIKEICILANKLNGKTAAVGNCCVKKFIGLPSEKIFQAVKRVRKDGAKSLNAETVDYAFEHQWISKWERDFYLDIMRKKVLSPKQQAKKSQVNQKVLVGLRRAGRSPS